MYSFGLESHLHHPVRKAELVVRARTDAQIVTELPVVEVVKTPVPLLA
jgi:hypothetical protein